MIIKGRIVFKGGTGSGNHGHSGRPGKVGGSGSNITVSNLKSEGWYLEDYHKRWIDSGEATIVNVTIADLIPRKGEPIKGADAPNQYNSKIQGILTDWNSGIRHPVIEGVKLANGKIRIADGRFRTVAQVYRGKKTIPIIIGTNSILKGGVGSGNFGHSGRLGKVGGSGGGGSTSKTLYHGTNADFDKFSVGIETVNSTTFGDVTTKRHAIFLTDNPEFAQEYGSNVKTYNLVGATMAKLDDDLRYDFVDTLDPFDERELWLLAKNTTGWGMLDGAVGERFSQFLTDKGYDGVIFDEDVKTSNGDWVDGTTYALLNTKKITSVAVK